MSLKKKILILTTRHIGDWTSGADTRMIKQLEHISFEFDVFVLHKELINEERKPKLYFDLNDLTFIKKVYYFKSNDTFFSKLFSKLSFRPSFSSKKNWLSKVEHLINETNPDVIQTDLFLASYYLPKMYRNKSIAYAQDSLIRFNKSGYLNSKTFIEKLRFSFKLFTYTIYEKCYFDYKKCVFVSDEDTQYYRKNTFDVINLSVDLQNFDVFNPNYKILFFGNLSYTPNEDSILFIIDKILPKIKQVNSKFKLIIAGSNITNKVKEKIDSKNIFLIDTPKNIFDVIKDSHIVLLPILWGSGQKNKVLEAMASNRPVVCSSHAVEGTKINEKHVYIAHKENDYFSSIIRIVDNPKSAIQIAKEGEKFVKKQYSSEASSLKYLNIINLICNDENISHN